MDSRESFPLPHKFGQPGNETGDTGKTMTKNAALGPNQHLVGQQGSRKALMTPAVVLDLDAFERNVAAMATMCKDAGLNLRPHAKTHKSATIAHAQVAAGALGICCATLKETRTMADGGVPGVLVTTPIVGQAKIAELAALAARAEGLMTVVDSMANLLELEQAVAATGKTMTVLVDIDIGMGRTGVTNEEAALALARHMEESEHLLYGGIQGYSGQVQHIEPFAERNRVYGGQLGRLAAYRDALAGAGLAPAIVSGGGTGTFSIDRAADVLTEHQAGSYIFMDVEYNAVELFPDRESPFQTALFIQCTVVSNNGTGYVTTDGGFKCFSADGPLPQIADGPPPGSTFGYYGDEYGKVTFADDNGGMELGERVTFVTPHCDPTINMHDYYHCVRGDTLVEIWPVDARGTL